MIFLYIFLYTLAAAGCIYILLVKADKHTELERPWVYVLWGMLWPVAMLPAMSYILAGKAINGEEEKRGQSEDKGFHRGRKGTASEAEY